MGATKDENNNFVDAKGAKWAIKLAQATGERLVISGNVEDEEFMKKRLSQI